LIVIFTLIFLIALPSNLFSFFTLRHPSCRTTGIGYYLLSIALINQISLGFLLARLTFISVKNTGLIRPLASDHIFCKSFQYTLQSSSRITYWLSSLVAVERAYSTVQINSRWLKQPHIARRILLATIMLVFGTGVYELLFIHALPSIDGQTSTCVLTFPDHQRSTWSYVHTLVSMLHSMVPFLINCVSTVIIIYIVIRNKLRLRLTKTKTNRQLMRVVSIIHDRFFPFQIMQFRIHPQLQWKQVRILLIQWTTTPVFNLCATSCGIMPR
jgi:hypothetical protein